MCFMYIMIINESHTYLDQVHKPVYTYIGSFLFLYNIGEVKRRDLYIKTKRYYVEEHKKLTEAGYSSFR